MGCTLNHIAVRDEQVAEFAHQLVPSAKVKVVPDVAFCARKFVSSPNNHRYKIKKDKGPIATLIIMPEWTEIPSFLDCLNFFVSECHKAGWTLLFLPFSPLYKHHVACRQLAEHYATKCQTITESGYFDAQTTLDILSQCDAVISHSYHAVLVSFALGIPPVALDVSFMRSKGPRTKLLSLCSSLGHDEAYTCPWVIHNKSMLWDAFVSVTSRGVNTKKVNRAIDKVEAHFNSMASIITGTIGP